MTKNIRDVLISGGDPLLLPDEKIKEILKKVTTRKSPRKRLKRRNRQSAIKRINNLHQEPRLRVLQGIAGPLKGDF